jgi:multicomponent K+:H+ antiporter subunit D
MVTHGASVMRFTQRAADNLHSPGNYIRAVLETNPKPSPTAKPVVTPEIPTVLPETGFTAAPDAAIAGGTEP